MVAQATMNINISFAAVVSFGFAQGRLTAQGKWHAFPLTLSLSKGLQLRLRRTVTPVPHFPPYGFASKVILESASGGRRISGWGVKVIPSSLRPFAEFTLSGANVLQGDRTHDF